MKRLLPLLVLFCVFGAVACSSDSSDESAEGSGSVELTMQSDTNELEAALEAQQERIDALEAQLANLPAGPDGATGPAGADGADGTDGADGATGPAGTDGADGTDGAVGPQGPAGDAGAAGAAGSAGAAGATGDAGAAGAAGSDGALSGLSCADEEFVATLDGSWQCAELGVTNDAQVTGSFDDNALLSCCDDLNGFMSFVNLDGSMTALNLDGAAEFTRNEWYLVVPGVTDYSACSLSVTVGGDSWLSTSAGVTLNTADPQTSKNSIHLDWNAMIPVGNLAEYQFAGNGTTNFAASISCGQGIVAAS